jgi:hypothetical protein
MDDGPWTKGSSKGSAWFGVASSSLVAADTADTDTAAKQKFEVCWAVGQPKRLDSRRRCKPSPRPINGSKHEPVDSWARVPETSIGDERAGRPIHLHVVIGYATTTPSNFTPVEKAALWRPRLLFFSISPGSSGRAGTFPSCAIGIAPARM